MRFVVASGAEAALAAITDGLLPPAPSRLPRRPAGAAVAEHGRAGGARGARFVVPGDLEWPSQLADLDLPAGDRLIPAGPPLGLWVRGPLEPAADGAALGGGGRVAGGDAYGSRVAADLGAGLADRGWATVSGAAYGIDAAAHRGALAAAGRRSRCIACGVDVAYPRGHHALFERIADEGVVVSERLRGALPPRARFLIRNRLIAALTPRDRRRRGGVSQRSPQHHGCGRGGMRRPVLGLPGPGHLDAVRRGPPRAA